MVSTITCLNATQMTSTGSKPAVAKLALIFALLACWPQLAKCDEANEQLFVRRIATILESKCQGCHGQSKDSLEGGLDLTNLKGAEQGGDSGANAIVRYRPKDSPIYLAASRISDKWSAMPPKEADRLTDQELTWLSDWILGGADWPNPVRAAEIGKKYEAAWSREDGLALKTSGGLSEAWNARRYKPETLWAYQPVRKPDLKLPASAAIDALIDQRRPEQLAAAPAAEAATLIRRVSFDLTGLPPTPQQIDKFVLLYQQDAELALKSLVDHLLESPHYGERMASHWLDVTRYADSSGFANDYHRGNAWRYRDYVVRAFNSDKPFDQFVREQIAGDEIDDQNPGMLIATGFLRMGPWELTGMEVAKIARQRFLDDVTNSVGETFLAHSLQCARCHDHKFDPIPTRDYYSIQAVFSATQLTERTADFLPSENVQGFEEQKYLEATFRDHQQTLEELDQQLLKNAQQWFMDQKIDATKWNAATQQAIQSVANRRNAKKNYSDIFATARNLLSKSGEAEESYPPKFVGFTPEQYGRERVARKGLERQRWELDRYQPVALSVYNGKTHTATSITSPVRLPEQPMGQGELEQTSILAGGDPFSPLEKVLPGILSVISDSVPASIPESVHGRRLALANWIAHPNNGLTTRAIVNRVWMWHFGQPIAGNPNNFGSTGQQPTHPELLDYLASRFVENGWSIKSLHRDILLSQTYRRSTNHPDPERLKKLDPLGTSYSAFKPRRLSAEELRDAMLFVSGELNLEIGGIPIRPEINSEVALQPRQVMGTFAEAWVPNPKPAQRNRRTIYALKLRGLSDPALEVMNAPSPDFSCERRESTLITPQVFSLFNSQSSQSRALALAARILRETDAESQAIQRSFQLCFGRLPDSRELRQCMDHWQELTLVQATLKPESNKPPTSVVREAIEENTGERFTFIEQLYSNADYVADLQPADCDAQTRAFADLCLVLLNANEFIYVY